MATEEVLTHSDLLSALEAADWSAVLSAVGLAERRVRGAIVGDPETDALVSKLVAACDPPEMGGSTGGSKRRGLCSSRGVCECVGEAGAR